MNTDVATVVDEPQKPQRQDERSEDGLLVELGVVSKDTKGGFGTRPDGGMFKQA